MYLTGLFYDNYWSGYYGTRPLLKSAARLLDSSRRTAGIFTCVYIYINMYQNMNIVIFIYIYLKHINVSTINSTFICVYM